MDAPKDDDRTQEKKPAPDLTEYLEHDAGRFTWMAAAVRSNTAAPYQLTSHRPVLPVGGFTGRDPFPALAQFQDYVARHQIHFFVVERLAAPPEGATGQKCPPLSPNGWSEPSRRAGSMVSRCST